MLQRPNEVQKTNSINPQQATQRRQAASGQALENLAAARQKASFQTQQPRLQSATRPGMQGITRPGVSSEKPQIRTQSSASRPGVPMTHAEFQRRTALNSQFQVREGPRLDPMEFTYPSRPPTTHQQSDIQLSLGPQMIQITQGGSSQRPVKNSTNVNSSALMSTQIPGLSPPRPALNGRFSALPNSAVPNLQNSQIRASGPIRSQTQERPNTQAALLSGTKTVGISGQIAQNSQSVQGVQNTSNVPSAYRQNTISNSSVPWRGSQLANSQYMNGFGQMHQNAAGQSLLGVGGFPNSEKLPSAPMHSQMGQTSSASQYMMQNLGQRHPSMTQKLPAVNSLPGSYHNMSSSAIGQGYNHHLHTNSSQMVSQQSQHLLNRGSAIGQSASGQPYHLPKLMPVQNGTQHLNHSGRMNLDNSKRWQGNNASIQTAHLQGVNQQGINRTEVHNPQQSFAKGSVQMRSEVMAEIPGLDLPQSNLSQMSSSKPRPIPPNPVMVRILKFNYIQHFSFSFIQRADIDFRICLKKRWNWAHSW